MKTEENMTEQTCAINVVRVYVLLCFYIMFCLHKKIYIRLLVSEKTIRAVSRKSIEEKVCSNGSVQILSIDPLIITYYRLEAMLLHTSLLFIDYTLSISIKVNI